MSGYCGSEDVLQSRHRGRESDSTDDHNKKKKQQKLTATFWDEVKHEKVDKLPGRSEGIIKGVGEKKRITKVLKDC